VSENLPGWVLMRPAPTLTSPWNSESVPTATPGGSSPSFSKAADRIRSSPVGISSSDTIFCSTLPTKLYASCSRLSLTYSAWPPKREPCAKSTPCAPGTWMSTTAPMA